MKTLISSLCVAGLLGSSAGFASLAMASDDDNQQGAHHEHHDSQKEHHKDENCPYQMGWKKDLTEDQQNQLSKLHSDYWAKKNALREKVKQARIAMMKEVIKDNPSQSVIDKKIDTALKLKREKMKLTVEHKIAVRKILTQEQRKLFDEHVLNMTEHGRHGKHGHHH